MKNVQNFPLLLAFIFTSSPNLSDNLKPCNVSTRRVESNLIAWKRSWWFYVYFIFGRMEGYDKFCCANTHLSRNTCYCVESQVVLKYFYIHLIFLRSADAWENSSTKSRAIRNSVWSGEGNSSSKKISRMHFLAVIFSHGHYWQISNTFQSHDSSDFDWIYIERFSAERREWHNERV